MFIFFPVNNLLLQLKSFTGTHYFCLLLILRKTLKWKTARQSSYKPSGLLGWPSGRCSCWDQGPLGASPRWKGHINKMLCLTEKNPRKQTRREQSSWINSNQIHIFYEAARWTTKAETQIKGRNYTQATQSCKLSIYMYNIYESKKVFCAHENISLRRCFFLVFPHFVYRDNAQKTNFVSLLQSDMSSYTIKWGTHISTQTAEPQSVRGRLC